MRITVILCTYNRSQRVGSVLTIPRYLFRHLAAWTLQWLVTSQPYLRFYRKMRVWQKAGEIVESYRAIDSNWKRGSGPGPYGVLIKRKGAESYVDHGHFVYL